MLQLPITVRIPSDEEIEHRPDIDGILFRRRKAKIVEGYTLILNDNPRLPYRFQALVNIDNSRLWDLFLALAATLPDKVSCVYGMYEEDNSVTTTLLQKQFVLQELEKYRNELTQDCALEVGLLFQTKDILLELGISDSKYIRYWGAELERFRLLMKSFKLPPVEGLEFIDEYPKIVTPLRDIVRTAKAPDTVLYYLDQAFHIDRTAPDPFFDL
jgi:hypothetical protein